MQESAEDTHAMKQADKPVVFWGKHTSSWIWACPDSVENCHATVSECYGQSAHWEIALLGANEHVLRFHDGGHVHLTHDMPTPAFGIPRQRGLDDVLDG